LVRFQFIDHIKIVRVQSEHDTGAF